MHQIRERRSPPPFPSLPPDVNHDGSGGVTMHAAAAVIYSSSGGGGGGREKRDLSRTPFFLSMGASETRWSLDLQILRQIFHFILKYKRCRREG